MTVAAKICGLTTVRAARTAAEAGASALGFVHFEPSPRHVSFEAARVLGPSLPPGVHRVGVFVDPDLETVEKMVGYLGLDWVQLHGREAPEFARQVKEGTGVQLMKAIGIETATDLQAADAFRYVADAFLFDAKPAKDDLLPGGNARSFPWEVMRDYKLDQPWYLAGGLTAETVAQAVRVSGAEAVDVSSSLELERGVKCDLLIRKFMAAVSEIT